MTDATPTQIVFLLFPGITQLDFTAPAQALSRMPGARLAGAAATREAIGTDSGFAIVPTHDFAACPQADILCVPGGKDRKSTRLNSRHECASRMTSSD